MAYWTHTYGCYSNFLQSLSCFLSNTWNLVQVYVTAINGQCVQMLHLRSRGNMRRYSPTVINTKSTEPVNQVFTVICTCNESQTQHPEANVGFKNGQGFCVSGRISLHVIKDLMQCNPQKMDAMWWISQKNEWRSNRRVKGFTLVNSVINNWWPSFSRFDLLDIWYMNCHLCFKGWMVQSAENGLLPRYKKTTQKISIFLKRYCWK